MSHTEPHSHTTPVPGLARMRPWLAWGLVALVALAGVAGWIASLARGDGLDVLVRLSGAGQISLVLIFPAVAALLWAAVGKPGLEVRLPATVLTVLVVLDVLTGVVFSGWGIVRGQGDVAVLAGAVVALLAKLGCALVAARVAAAPQESEYRSASGIAVPRRTEVVPDQDEPAQGDGADVARHQPTWQPHQAAGGAWLRAGDAATGASASAWGTPPESSAVEPGTTGARPAPQWVPQQTPPRPPQE